MQTTSLPRSNLVSGLGVSSQAKPSRTSLLSYLEMPKGQQVWDMSLEELCRSVTLRMGARVNHALHFPASNSSDGGGGEQLGVQ